jgi:hypothetical protein
MKKAQKNALVLLLGFIVMMSSAAVQAGYQDDNGGYRVNILQVDTNNDAIVDSYVYAPAFYDTSRHPIVLFCVGTGGDPTFYDLFYNLLYGYASHGIVVIASAEPNQNTENGKAALLALNWLINQNTKAGSYFQNRLATNRIVLAGHSQGAAACVNIANGAVSNAAVPEITAILSFMAGDGMNGSYCHPPVYSDLDVPIFFVTSSVDWMIPSSLVLEHYDATPYAPAWYGCHKGTILGHLSFPATMQKTSRAWLYAHLYNDSDAKNVFYGNNWTFQNDPDWKDQRRKNVW